MKIHIVNNYDEMSKLSAKLVADQIIKNPKSVLGLATGSTPEGMYREIVKMYEEGKLSFKEITTFNLDEYYGLDPKHFQSYRYFMESHLLSKVDINQDNVYIPNGMCTSIEDTCKEYDEFIEKSGGIDLQILGIGINGHIGFNEPGDEFVANTHLVDLTDATLDANSRFFESQEDVPSQAITMGMESIMQAKSIILMASGKSKADAIHMAIEGPITPQVPASILQLHSDVIIVIDREAASKLIL